jgi:hypothetical protein
MRPPVSRRLDQFILKLDSEVATSRFSVLRMWAIVRGLAIAD